MLCVLCARGVMMVVVRIFSTTRCAVESERVPRCGSSRPRMCAADVCAADVCAADVCAADVCAVDVCAVDTRVAGCRRAGDLSSGVTSPVGNLWAHVALWLCEWSAKCATWRYFVLVRLMMCAHVLTTTTLGPGSAVISL